MTLAMLATLTGPGSPIALADTATGDSAWRQPATGEPRRSIGLTLDNDLLAFSRRDSDYTGGVSVTFAADRDARWRALPSNLWRGLDRLLPASADSFPTRTVDALQLGLMAFTPDDLRAPQPLPLDRPYASLLFATASSTRVHADRGHAHTVSLTVGVMGLRVAGDAQRGLHQLLGQQKVPRGWANQISAGGEPTAQMSWAHQTLLFTGESDGARRSELKWRAQLDAGYLTEASLALTGRWGRIHSPWWGFGSERGDYATQSVPDIGLRSAGVARELYLWAGVRVRARGYNALLQGQWRHSPVRVPSSRVHHLLAEASLGVTWRFTPTWQLTYVARYKTPEIRRGPAARDLAWAGLTLSHSF